MKKVGLLPLFLLFFNFYASAHTGNLNAGQPGCLPLIQGKVITDQAAKGLSRECQDFRNTYLMGLELYNRDPKKLSAAIKAAIRESVMKKSAAPPYDALLLALYTNDLSAKNDIQKRADFEKKSKVLFSYGAALLERWNTGRCPNYQISSYREICESKDLIFEDLIAIKAKAGAS
jgi:hypothetical protein